MSDYALNLKRVQERIHNSALACGRNPESIRLIAVGKTNPVEAVQAFHALGQFDFGENKVQEMVDKWTVFPNPDLQWHMIGAMQSNKIKYLAERVNWIHSIPKVDYLKEVEKRFAAVNRSVNVLIQVNISDEDQKSGCNPDDLPSFFEFAQSCKHFTIKGLMGIGSLEPDPEINRPQFKLLAELLKEHQNKWTSECIQLSELSMGMTHDLEVAIQEGATMIRVGTALFGARNYV